MTQSVEGSTTDSHLKRRIRKLNAAAPNFAGSGPVIYVMSRDQRVNNNHALLAAQKTALKNSKPLEVVFVINRGSGNRAREHYSFMLNGLEQVRLDLQKLNIKFSIFGLSGPSQKSADILLNHFADNKTSAVFFDMNPLKGPRQIVKQVSASLEAPVYLVDTHNIVPVWLTSDKQEIAARTLRPKINRQLVEFLVTPEKIVKHPFGTIEVQEDPEEFKANIKKFLSSLPTNGQILEFESGTTSARLKLRNFIHQRLANYPDKKNDPNNNCLSNLSAYLHFGQISSLEVALEVIASPNNEVTEQAREIFLEELVVRKELSDNFCWYNTEYNSLNGAPEWAKLMIRRGTPVRYK